MGSASTKVETSRARPRPIFSCLDPLLPPSIFVAEGWNEHCRNSLESRTPWNCRRGDNSKVFEIPKNFYNVRSNPRQRKSTEGEGGRGTKRLDEVSRVTSQLSSRRNPRPYLFAIYAHLERNLGRAPTAPSTFTTASITRRKNVSLRYVRPPFSLSLSLSLSVAGKGRQRIVFQNFHGGHQWRRVH